MPLENLLHLECMWGRRTVDTWELLTWALLKFFLAVPSMGQGRQIRVELRLEFFGLSPHITLYDVY